MTKNYHGNPMSSLKSLTKKLACCTRRINQIADSIPKSLHMNFYHTVFESYITYSITVQGYMPDSKLQCKENYCEGPDW